MEKWVAILQPAYLPWLGFFDQLDAVDLFILLDDVQYTRLDWRSRNRILTAQGPLWLSVPVRHRLAGRSYLDARINEIEIDNTQRWARRHWLTIRQAYARSAHGHRYLPELEPIYAAPHRRLVDLDEALRAKLATWLGIDTKVATASELATGTQEKSERLVELCRLSGATDYLSGAAARGYLDRDAFTRAGIRVWFQDYQHPTYPQVTAEFVSHLSALDLLCHVGPASLEVLRSGSRRSPAEAS